MLYYKSNNYRNGGKCFLRCEGRSVLYNITYGGLGSAAGAGVSANPGHVYCLWILTVFSDLEGGTNDTSVPSITFTMEPDMQLMCSQV